MNIGVIKIGGREYPVKALTVRQQLRHDMDQFDKKIDPVDLRLRRLALALQNGDAFLPDPANPSGSFSARSMSTEAVAKWLEEPETFTNMIEFYDAEIELAKVSGLGGKGTPVQGE